MAEHRSAGDRDQRRERLRERARAEFVTGAEDDHRRLTGRSMTTEELERVLRRFPGDV
jgi:hypothetical protein